MISSQKWEFIMKSLCCNADVYIQHAETDYYVCYTCQMLCYLRKIMDEFSEFEIKVLENELYDICIEENMTSQQLKDRVDYDVDADLKDLLTHLVDKVSKRLEENQKLTLDR